jgi:hypothetical protein
VGGVLCLHGVAARQYLACEGCLSISRGAMEAVGTLLRMAQSTVSVYVYVPRPAIEITCLRKRQDESRAAKLMQDAVCAASMRLHACVCRC